MVVVQVGGASVDVVGVVAVGEMVVVSKEGTLGARLLLTGVAALEGYVRRQLGQDVCDTGSVLTPCL